MRKPKKYRVWINAEWSGAKSISGLPITYVGGDVLLELDDLSSVPACFRPQVTMLLAARGKDSEIVCVKGLGEIAPRWEGQNTVTGYTFYLDPQWREDHG
jgi:hypothetical protein